MTIRRIAKRRAEENLANVGVPPQDNQAPPKGNHVPPQVKDAVNLHL